MIGADEAVPPDVSLRVARPEDEVAVRRVVDAAMLSVDGLPERLAAGDVLVATAADRVVGAVVLDPDGPDRDRDPPAPVDAESAAHVRAVAVLRGRRGQGIGTALIAAALDREGRLVADFDPAVRPFYEALDFDVETTDGGRCWGVRSA